MGKTAKFPVWLGLVLLSATFVLAGCKAQATETPSVHSRVQVLSAHAQLEEAWRMALQWRGDSRLVEIQASVASPKQVNIPYIEYQFHSPSENRLIFVVSCYTGGCSGQEFQVPTTLPFGPVELDDDMIDSIDAAQIGIQNGGERFLSNNHTTMWVRLGTDNPRDIGPVVWLAFFSSLPSGQQLRVVIDPYTRDVIRIEE